MENIIQGRDHLTGSSLCDAIWEVYNITSEIFLQKKKKILFNLNLSKASDIISSLQEVRKIENHIHHIKRKQWAICRIAYGALQKVSVYGWKTVEGLKQIKRDKT